MPGHTVISTMNSVSDTLVLIPARMASVRLPGKPLADIAGKPMIVHVADRAREAEIGRPVVCTDTPEIVEAVRAHGHEAVITRADHPSGSDRIWEAVTRIDPEGRARFIVNVQGDLPTIEPQLIRAAVEPLADRTVDIATLGVEIVQIPYDKVQLNGGGIHCSTLPLLRDEV